jgi:cyclophilin family peptidyl-prolyl cis-trans isomerase
MHLQLSGVLGAVVVASMGCTTPRALDAAVGTDAPPADVTSADTPAASDAPGSEYVPPGFTRTEDLSSGGTHSFAAAGSVLRAATDYRMVVETDAGRIVIDLFEEDAPVAVNSFVFLARHHFFDGILFHRVIEGFMAQSGDPNTLVADRARWGFGGCGYEYDVESVPENTFDAAGIVATANAGPTTNGSQFFITFAARPSLPSTEYTIFGELTEGLDVLPAIVRGEPAAIPTAIETAYIVERPR